MQRVLQTFQSHVLICILHYYTVIILTLLNIEKDAPVTQSVAPII